MAEIKKKKIFTFSKIKDEDILRDVKEYFIEPKKYLNKMEHIFVGPSYLKKMSTPKNIDPINGLGLSSIQNNNTQYQKTLDNNNNNNKNKDKENNQKNIITEKMISNNIDYSFSQTQTQLKNRRKLSMKDLNDNNNKIKENLKINKLKETKDINNNNKDNFELPNDVEKFNYLEKFLLNHSHTHTNTQTNTQIENQKQKITENKPKLSKTQRPQSVNIGIHYQYKSPKDVIEAFLNGKNREKIFLKGGTNNLFPKEVDDIIRNQFFSQEKILKAKNKHENECKEFSRKLSEKCNKKEENLLINTIDHYYLRKQLVEYLENNKTLSERFGRSYWYIDLRRPQNLKQLRKNFINIGENGKENWKLVNDPPSRKFEIARGEVRVFQDNNKNFDTNNVNNKNLNFYEKKYCDYNDNNKEKKEKEKSKKLIDLIIDEKKNKKNKFKLDQSIDDKKNKKIRKKLKTSYSKIKMPNLIELKIEGKNEINFEEENFLDYNKTIQNENKVKVYIDPSEGKIKNVKDCIFKSLYEYKGVPVYSLLSGFNKEIFRDKYKNKNITSGNSFNLKEFKNKNKFFTTKNKNIKFNSLSKSKYKNNFYNNKKNINKTLPH